MYAEINDLDSLHEYIHGTFIDSIFSNKFQHGNKSVETTGAGSSWVVLGPVRISQLRSQRYDCTSERPSMFRGLGAEYYCTHNRGYADTYEVIFDTEVSSAPLGYPTIP